MLLSSHTFIMLLPGCHFARTTIFFTVFFFAVTAHPIPEEDKTFNLKIGFDLTHGENGAPSLRIRDFEESREFSPRAGETGEKEEKHNKSDKSEKPAPRADSSNSDAISNDDNDKQEVDDKKSSNESKSKVKASGEAKASVENSDSNSEVDTKDKHSTRGLLPREFEPEDKDPKLHGRDDSDDDGK